MADYRRNYEGELFFFTVVTQKRVAMFHDPKARELLRNAIGLVQQRHPWDMTAIVLLPNHFHMIWKMPPDDTNYSFRIGQIKRTFTKQYLANGGREAKVSASQRNHRQRGVWQRRFWEHTIRDARDFQMHLDYIHGNPVKHGLVEKPCDWPWTSFHRYVEMGHYEPDWHGRCDLPGNIEYHWPEE